jgi:hypothetical protein
MTRIVDRFAVRSGADEVCEMTSAFVEAFELPRHLLGETWGISIPARDRGWLVRVNAGGQQLFVSLFDSDGWHCAIATQASPEVVSALPSGITAHNGQAGAPYAEQLLVQGRLREMHSLMRRRKFVTAVKPMVDHFTSRRLWGSNWATNAAAEHVLGYGHGAHRTTNRMEGGSFRSVGIEVFAPYRRAKVTTESDSGSALPRDTDAYERGVRSHVELQNRFADRLRTAGYVPTSPIQGGPANFDLAFEGPGRTLYVVEVKSSNETNKETQLRLGLGQLLRYRHSLAQTTPNLRAVLLIENRPSDPTWTAVCAEHDVVLVAEVDTTRWIRSLGTCSW